MVIISDSTTVKVAVSNPVSVTTIYNKNFEPYPPEHEININPNNVPICAI